MLEKYETLNRNAKIFLLHELKKRNFHKYKNIDVFGRCNKELDLLYDKGLLFLIEILYKYKKHKSRLPISYHFRGTINNLLLLYVLGITDVDPIKYNLPYELFNDNTICVDLIRAVPLDFLRYVGSNYSNKVKFVYGNHEKEDIEEINALEDNHYLLIPFFRDNKDNLVLKDISLRLNENFILETVNDYRKYKDEFLTIRIDEKQPISDYREKGLVNVLTNEFEKEIARILQPKTITDYIKVKSIGHGTDVWNDNQDVLVAEGKITLDNLIATREDILEYLLDHSIDRDIALEIFNFIRKGQAKRNPTKWDEYVIIMKEHNCEDMFVDIFSKILFIFGRGQAVSECLFSLDEENYIKK